MEWLKQSAREFLFFIPFDSLVVFRHYYNVLSISMYSSMAGGGWGWWMGLVKSAFRWNNGRGWELGEFQFSKDLPPEVFTTTISPSIFPLGNGTENFIQMRWGQSHSDSHDAFRMEWKLHKTMMEERKKRVKFKTNFDYVYIEYWCLYYIIQSLPLPTLPFCFFPIQFQMCIFGLVIGIIILFHLWENALMYVLYLYVHTLQRYNGNFILYASSASSPLPFPHVYISFQHSYHTAASL